MKKKFGRTIKERRKKGRNVKETLKNKNRKMNEKQKC